ncbi:hypothetical protein HHI36_010120 [Cryptolaemus montrouzieri]|uniref:Beta-1,4-mannosyl-glycoprotein 4-beta-N-acetylglucosaminyltransferase n=1 Tax=Cryptolaemus montrouzieri TaxID=559131 RepID=A0ABD2MIL3_9CUCU
MYFCKINYRILILWIFVIIQILLIILYYYVQKGETTEFYNGRISFLNSEHFGIHSNKTYHKEGDIIKLRKHRVRDKFVDFNSSLCFMNGTDLKSMNRLKNSWACNCKTGWHGLECGQPEVVWRALLTYRKKLNIKGPRPFARRILYISEVDEFVENLIEVRVNELYEVVDMFILIENNGSKIEKLLNNDFLKKYHKQIFYLQNQENKDVWLTVSSSVHDLENDDIILMSKSFEIPNKFTLTFIKYYDNWPEPISFRLRWSVFGFFWKHPDKTRTEGIACSVKYMKKNFDANFKYLRKGKTEPGLIFGDLNHYGGWYCEYCMQPYQVIKFANQNEDVKILKWKELNKVIIDTSYIEDLIENGLYIDGKTELGRSRKYQDNYFAPGYVLDNSMKFDYLLINLYTKLDYYEG